MWALEALKHDYRVALIAGGTIDLTALNNFYGTSIRADECETVELKLPWPLAKVEWGSALRGAFVSRSMRNHLDTFDVLISAYNIADFGRPAIHHLADFSWDETLRRRLDPSPAGLRKLLHEVAPLRSVYLAFVRAVARAPKESFREVGLVLANSDWSRTTLRERHGIDSALLYPPLPIRIGAVSAQRSQRRFVSLGRIYPEKRIEMMIQIIETVRSRGHDLSLHIIGDVRETAYGREIERLCSAKGRWIVLEGRRFGDSKMRLLAESAFGIHARQGEAFGIAVAEMMAAGCIPFVPREGGPAEIVDHEALLYDDHNDAVEKILAVLNQETLRETLTGHLRRQAEMFSNEHFISGLRAAVKGFLEGEDRLSSKAAAAHSGIAVP